MNRSYLWAYDDQKGWNLTTHFSFFNDFQREDEDMKYAEVTSIVTLCLISLAINISLISLIVKTKELRENQQNMYIVSVSCSTMLLLPCAVLVGGSRLSPSGWPYGSFVCKFAMYAFLVTAFIKIWLMTVISLDRYLMVVCDQKYHLNKMLSTLLNLAAWFFPGFSLAFMVYSNTDSATATVDNQTVSICSAMFKYDPVISYALVYFSTVFVLEYFIPMTIIIVCYVGILRKVKVSSMTRGTIRVKQIFVAQRESNQKKTNNKEQKTTRILIAIFVIFLIMWTPLFGLLAMLSLDQKLESYKLTSRYIVLQLCILVLNTIIEPFLFSLTTGPVRQRLLQLFRGVKTRSKVAPSSMYNTTVS
ncbi:SSTR2 [Bugula neritina]|uniref:SSTR2 n=1 Tax=Bugula neritina TaxID=10212 RepID=A0A7J7IUF9_BUGNE|nr:SSTR2 [Bugula neritina]